MDRYAADDFEYDVFLSHSSKDTSVVGDIAQRLKEDGLRVWFDSWEIRPGDSIPAKIEDGLENSRVLILLMSANAFGSEWAQLESGTFRYRDPLNKARRFLPVRLDDTPIKGALAQFLFISWLPGDREDGYRKLLEASRPIRHLTSERQAAQDYPVATTIKLDTKSTTFAYAFSGDGKRALTCNDDYVALWDLETANCLRMLEGHTGKVYAVSWSSDQRRALSASADTTLRLWNVETGECLREFKGHTDKVWGAAFSSDQSRALSGADDNTVRLWDVATGRCQLVLEGHKRGLYQVAWSPDERRALSCDEDKRVFLWDLETGRCLHKFEGHEGAVYTVAWSDDMRRALSSSQDKTVRLWNLETGACLRVIEGHTSQVKSVVWSPDQQRALSCDEGGTVRLWDLQTGRCLQVLEGHTAEVNTLVWYRDQELAISGDSSGLILVRNLSKSIVSEPSSKTDALALSPTETQIQYTNAKVLLVGESGAGKTGLSKVLSGEKWEPSDSTVGAWATQWKLPIASTDDVEREIWLWDFGGQADQRLIHQLYMDETALAVLVFDGQKEDLFETLGQWDRDLTRASTRGFSKLLVAGRVDAGGLRVSRAQIEAFKNERGYLQWLETSAKSNLGCDALKQAILDGIRWNEIPWRSSPLLFKRLKEEIVRLKDAGRVLMRFNELRETLQLRLSGEFTRFTDDELHAVVSLLTGPGVVWELKFGSWVLLQPERINAYAQAVIQTLREDEHERGCLPEQRVLSGDLAYHSSMARLPDDEERFVLLAMHQTLVERGLCLREYSEKGTLLVFPSYYRRERPDLAGHPAVLVSYRFSGFLDEIYATLVVRLHHTEPFKQEQLWRYAADFKTLTEKQLGVKLTRRGEGAGELEVYFDPTIGIGEKIIFSKYVHEHLLDHARDVERLRHYVCPHCNTPVGNREVAMRKLAEGRRSILCVNCEKRVPLWDEMEELFASPDVKQQVRDLQEKSAGVLDNESRERALVGDVISTVELAGQISRELSVRNHGIDMEIEFMSNTGAATGKKLFLQLKSSDSYVRKQKRDGVNTFTIKNERHARYWLAQAFPVLLVIRNSEGDVRWMDVSDYLRRAGGDTKRLARLRLKPTRCKQSSEVSDSSGTTRSGAEARTTVY
jgi:small GTP-binding protein